MANKPKPKAEDMTSSADTISSGATAGGFLVYSTLSNDQRYTEWNSRKVEQARPNQKVREVFIKGKANVVDRTHLMTPRGAVTTVSAGDMALLESIDAFQRHKEAGYLLVEKKPESTRAAAPDPDIAALDMQPADKSAPLTPESFEVDKKPKTKTNKK